MSEFRVYAAPPDGLLDAPPEKLANIVGAGPALVHFAGEMNPPLVVVTLLHGNEISGWLAVRRLLKRRRGGLRRSMALLIGNTRAAARGARFLPGGADWNRVWGGGEATATFAEAALAEFCARGIFAAIDIHNNTGRNPCYAIAYEGGGHAQASASLAAGFSGVVVETRLPRGTCVEALSSLAPATLIECGTPGNAAGVARAARFLESCLAERLPREAGGAGAPMILRSTALVRVPTRRSVGFGTLDRDINFPAGVERRNFRETRTGAIFARLRPGIGKALEVTDESGLDVSSRYFFRDRGMLKVARPFVPAMLAANEKAVRDDRLCDVLERK